MSKHLLAVKHNIEVAHRLHLLPGKCENIHGHSMNVIMHIEGVLDGNGILEGISFTDLKFSFRNHLDKHYDHHVLLHQDDPFAKPLALMYRDVEGQYTEESLVQTLPGLQPTPGDPTTENIAMWIAKWAQSEEIPVHSVDVWETQVNMARYEV